MYKIQAASLEWAIKHLTNYYDSDFFPKPFEFEVIKYDWNSIKTYLLNVDLENYIPKSPFVLLAPKPGGTYRVVHQLEPIDSIIYTALLYENARIIEGYRINETKKISCSYRIKVYPTGSFFNPDTNGYPTFLKRAAELADEYEDGVVLTCDIVDFYNQINLQQVNNVLSEAKSNAGKVIEKFLRSLNPEVQRGVPVGPAASILIAEVIMSDIDKKISQTTDDFVQYVDDMYIFFTGHYEAEIFLHELSKYLYYNHRLVLSPDKTKIVSIAEFKAKYLEEESDIEKRAIEEQLKELVGGYSSAEEVDVDDFDDLDASRKFKIRSEIYPKLFKQAAGLEKIDLALLRHILRQAGKFKIEKIIPLIFKNFDTLLPVVREVVIYFDRVLNEEIVTKYEKKFEAILSSPYLKLPFINMWIFTLFQNEWFNSTKIKIDYSKILRIREAALIANREKNMYWLKDKKNGIDTIFGIWDSRSIIFSSRILSRSELKSWLNHLSSKGDIVDKALCEMLLEEID
jgi:hypothetical protein